MDSSARLSQPSRASCFPYQKAYGFPPWKQVRLSCGNALLQPSVLSCQPRCPTHWSASYCCALQQIWLQIEGCISSPAPILRVWCFFALSNVATWRLVIYNLLFLTSYWVGLFSKGLDTPQQLRFVLEKHWTSPKRTPKRWVKIFPWFCFPFFYFKQQLDIFVSLERGPLVKWPIHGGKLLWVLHFSVFTKTSFDLGDWRFSTLL